jgi:hypothetical protein
MDIMELGETAKGIIKAGSKQVRVKRAGMYQFQTFTIKRIKHGNESFVELFLDKVLDMSELIRLANELGLPVESQNGRAFPPGTGAKDFVGL